MYEDMNSTEISWIMLCGEWDTALVNEWRLAWDTVLINEDAEEILQSYIHKAKMCEVTVYQA